MKSIVTLNDIERMKDALRASLPDVKSSHRVKARGLGWATNASMRAALAATPAATSPDEGTFLDYLRLHSFDAPGGTLLRAFAQAGLDLLFLPGLARRRFALASGRSVAAPPPVSNPLIGREITQSSSWRGKNSL